MEVSALVPTVTLTAPERRRLRKRSLPRGRELLSVHSIIAFVLKVVS